MSLIHLHVPNSVRLCYDFILFLHVPNVPFCCARLNKILELGQALEELGRRARTIRALPLYLLCCDFFLSLDELEVNVERRGLLLCLLWLRDLTLGNPCPSLR